MIGAAHDLLAAAGVKLHTPLLRTRIHISARVTIFLSAAGFGKTYAMADACERLRGEGASVAWLSSGALALHSGDIYQGIHRFFDLFAEAETIFIDDLDMLSPNQRQALLRAFVLTAPHRKIVLATRTLEDLGAARLLADGAAQLIQADTLRWRPRQLSDLWQSRLTAKQIDRIDELAQGWPAVSQLLAQLILKGGDLKGDAALLNASLAADYIRDEVLSSFTSAELSVLAMTSLVDACDDALIRRLSKESTLTSGALDRRLPGLCDSQSCGGRVSYNRALRIYLQQVFETLPDKTRAQALGRTADWASARGDIASAGNLAARAGDRQRIVDYVTKAGGLRIWFVNGHDDLRAIVAAADAALVTDDPRLKLLKCIVLLKDGRVGEALRLYQDAAPDLPSDPETVRGAALVRVSLMVYGCEAPLMSEADFEITLSSLNEDPVYRQIAPTLLAIRHSQQADFDAATAAIAVARAYDREAGMTYNLMYLDVHSAGVAMARGRLDVARKHLSKARLRWRAGFAGDQAAETVIVALAAQLAFERGNISQAKQHVGHVAHRLPHSEAWLDIYFAGYEPMLRLLGREQGLGAALAAVERSARQLQDGGLDRIATALRHIGTCLIGEAIVNGDRGVVLPKGEVSSEVASESWQEKEYRLLAWAYEALANRKHNDARGALDALITFADQHGLLRTKQRALLLRQVVHDRLGAGDLAIADFHAALEIGVQTGIRQAFVEFGAETVKARILAGIPERFADFAEGLANLIASRGPNRSPGILTPRESQVLELLTSGDSDKGIARQIHVTEYAVQFHLKNIYRKLGVRDRHAAVERHRSA